MIASNTITRTLEEYSRIGEPSQRERAEAWQMAIGLQAVDQLRVSRYLLATASEHVEKYVEKTADRIVAAMRINPGITSEMLQMQLGLSRRGIEDNIARLKKRGRITRQGEDKGGKWLVND